MRTETITADKVNSYYNCIPEPFIEPIRQGKLLAVGGLFTDERQGAVVWEEREGGKGILKSLFVLPEARRLGLGSLLLKPLKGKVLDFSYEATEDRANLEPFFDNNNIFYGRTDYPKGRLTVAEAMEALRKKKVDQAPFVGMFFDELLLEEKTAVQQWLAKTCQESQMDYTSLNPSSVYLLEDGEVKSAMLFSKAERGTLGVDYVFCVKGTEAKLAGMMKKAMQLMSRQFRPEAEITMLMTTEQGLKLYSGLFGEPNETIPVISGTLDGDKVWEEEE